MSKHRSIEFDFRKIRIPFRFQYGHAKKQHRGLEAVICRAIDTDGRVGLGEAVPRRYVTGETCGSVIDAMESLAGELLPNSSNIAELLSQRRQLAANWRGPFPSCAVAAIDTALLELQARQQGCSFAELLDAHIPAELVYSASIGISSRPKLLATLLAYRAMGLHSFKVKVGDAEDIERIRFIRRILGRDARLFADANAGWEPEAAIRHIEALADLGIWAVEEPLQTAEAPIEKTGQADRFSILDDEHYEKYRRLRERSPLPLIADESLICLQTAEKIIEHAAFDILNIRQSKCGGPLFSTAIVELARNNDLKFSCGAMVGETPILATAGAHFGAAHKDHLYIQGFSHRLLHSMRFVRGEPKMHHGGRLMLAPVNGLGLAVDDKLLDKVTISQSRLPR